MQVIDILDELDVDDDTLDYGVALELQKRRQQQEKRVLLLCHYSRGRAINPMATTTTTTRTPHVYRFIRQSVSSFLVDDLSLSRLCSDRYIML